MTLCKLRQLSIAASLSGILILSGCHKKVPGPAVPPPPPPTAAPTATISTNPAAIQQGRSATLVWKTTDATETTISGLGTVAATGSQSVSPTDSTSYTLTAKGQGGVVQASTRITVTRIPSATPLPPVISEDDLFTQNIRDIYFNYDQFDIRPEDSSIAQQDAAFLAKYTGMKVVIEGHCDDRGSAEYNIALGQNRAESFRKALVTDGVAASRIRVISYGKEKPFCTEENEQCWQQNRRAHLKLDR